MLLTREGSLLLSSAGGIDKCRCQKSTEQRCALMCALAPVLSLHSHSRSVLSFVLYTCFIRMSSKLCYHARGPTVRVNWCRVSHSIGRVTCVM